MSQNHFQYRILREDEAKGDNKYVLTRDYEHELIVKRKFWRTRARVSGQPYPTTRDGVTIDWSVPCIRIPRGFQWDGPSGPAVDTADWMRASCVHDALYGAFVDNVLPAGNRAAADREMLAILREDGMGWFRYSYSWLAVHLFGGLWPKAQVRK